MQSSITVSGTAPANSPDVQPPQQLGWHYATKSRARSYERALLLIVAGHSRRVSNSWLRGRPESGREFRGAGSPAPIPDEAERRLTERTHVRTMPLLTATLPEPPSCLPNTRVPSRGIHTPRYLSRLRLQYNTHCGANSRSTVVTCVGGARASPKASLVLDSKRILCCPAPRD